MRLKYVLSEVAVGLWRNVTMTIAMIITMAVSLTLLGASVLLYLQVDHMREVYYEQVEVTIFLKTQDTTRAEGRDRGRPEARPARRRRRLRDQAGGVRAVQGDLRGRARADRTDQAGVAARVVPGQAQEPEHVRRSSATKYEKYIGTGGIDTIVDQKQLVEKVFSVLGSLQTLALIIAIVQGVAALMLVINTIQVAAYSKRREVAVMKLVGASNWFIQAPFVLEAVAAGLIGAILAYGTLVLAKIYVFDGALEPLTSVLTPMPWSNVNLMLPLLAGAGALVSSVTGWFALRFYIRV